MEASFLPPLLPLPKKPEITPELAKLMDRHADILALPSEAFLEVRDDEKNTLLHYLVCYDKVHPHSVHKALTVMQNAHAVDQQNAEGYTALHYLAYFSSSSNFVTLVEYFDKKNALFSAADQEGNTPLHIAMAREEPYIKINDRKRVLVPKILIECGADLTCRNAKGERAIDLATHHSELYATLHTLEKSLVQDSLIQALHALSPALWKHISTILKKTIQEDYTLIIPVYLATPIAMLETAHKIELSRVSAHLPKELHALLTASPTKESAKEMEILQTAAKQLKAKNRQSTVRILSAHMQLNSVKSSVRLSADIEKN